MRHWRRLRRLQLCGAGPAVFLILPQESLDLKHLVQLQSALGDQQFEEVDFVVHSGGGNINVAYQIVELIRLHTKRLFVCVPFYAKSAATLLCLGADEIVPRQIGPARSSGCPSV